MADFRAIDSVRTTHEPNALLFSPIDSSVLVVGTYHLREDGHRTGTLLLYSFSAHTFKCQLCQTLSCSAGVLDAKWLIDDPRLLTVALANGSVEVYELKVEKEPSPSLHRVGGIQYFEERSLVLSLADSTSTPLLATLSTGELSTLNIHASGTETLSKWKAHDLEVWCGAWKSPDLVLSGGDDALLRLWDLRLELSKPQASNKSHGAGVVSILPVTDTLFLTGSYDNQMRSFDYRNLRSPISSIDLDGGVWRILPRPGSNSTSLLACCMQEGARIVRLSGNGSFECERKFEPQEDRRLVYGGGWQTENIAALCSFYEKQLYICSIP